MVTYHPWYHNFRPELANNCLAEAAELGAGYIRIDIRWKDLIPDGRHVDEGAWTWYNSYLRAARDWYGLQPLIVLSNPPRLALRYSLDSRLSAWNQYVDEVAHRVGSLCSVYQLLNEPNNFVYAFFPPKLTLAAILSGSRVIRQHNSSAQIAINVLAGLWRWQTDLEEILRACGSAVDIVGLDYYPGTWTVSGRTDSSNWNQFIEFIARTKEASVSPLGGRRMAIIETGYATNLQPWRSEQQQANYFRTLENAIIRLDARIGRDGLALVGIHELSDGDTHAFLDPEAHFGLLTSDTLRRKAAFDVVGRIFRAIQ
jgi:beta-glucosidase/6-phospho-beta-glucosidase/beta-galactosidase